MDSTKKHNCGKWTAEEEARLYNGILIEGWGSWTAIASKHVKSRLMTQAKSRAQKLSDSNPAFAALKIESPRRKKAASSAFKGQMKPKTDEIDSLMSDRFSFLEEQMKIKEAKTDEINNLRGDELSSIGMEGMDDLDDDVPLLNEISGTVHDITPPRLYNCEESIKLNFLNTERQSDMYKQIFNFLQAPANFNNPNEVIVNADSSRRAKPKNSVLRARILGLLQTQSNNSYIHSFLDHIFAIYTIMFDFSEWFAVDPESSSFVEDQDDVLNILFLVQELWIRTETMASSLITPHRMRTMPNVLREMNKNAMHSIDIAFAAAYNRLHGVEAAYNRPHGVNAVAV